jgi:hypothetical protein
VSEPTAQTAAQSQSSAPAKIHGLLKHLDPQSRGGKIFNQMKTLQIRGIPLLSESFALQVYIKLVDEQVSEDELEFLEGLIQAGQLIVPRLEQIISIPPVSTDPTA